MKSSHFFNSFYEAADRKELTHSLAALAGPPKTNRTFRENGTCCTFASLKSVEVQST